MADAQRPGGVGTDELDHHPAPATHLAAAKTLAALKDGGNQSAPDLGVDGDVDETWASNGTGGDQFRFAGEALDHHLGDLPGILFVGTGDHQGKVGGEISHALVLGNLDGKPSGSGLAPQTVRHPLGEQVIQRRLQLSADHCLSSWVSR